MLNAIILDFMFIQIPLIFCRLIFNIYFIHYEQFVFNTVSGQCNIFHTLLTLHLGTVPTVRALYQNVRPPALF